MILTLAKNGTNFTHGNERSYDVWGTPSDNGDPAQRYCANLGHVTDDESGLIYMRARYYEPSTGRFLSEDSARDGSNWYVYCGNEPVGRVDPDGKAGIPRESADLGFALFFLYCFLKGTDISFTSLARHLAAALGGMALDRLDRRFAWVDTAAKRYAALLRLDRIQNPSWNYFQFHPTRKQAVVMFYSGYSLALF